MATDKDDYGEHYMLEGMPPRNSFEVRPPWILSVYTDQ